jgi:hypothetical protein
MQQKQAQNAVSGRKLQRVGEQFAYAPLPVDGQPVGVRPGASEADVAGLVRQVTDLLGGHVAAVVEQNRPARAA